MLVLRLSKELLDVNGVMVTLNEDNSSWKSLGRKLSSMEFIEIYTFLDNERREFKKQFNDYVSKTIDYCLNRKLG